MDVREDIGLRFIQVSEQILTASRNELYMDQHYLALALGGLEFSVTTQLDGVGTDGEHLVVHPKVLAELFQKNRLLVNRIYLHQVYHCLFRHIFKRIRLKPEYWMVACDKSFPGKCQGGTVQKSQGPERGRDLPRPDRRSGGSCQAAPAAAGVLCG